MNKEEIQHLFKPFLVKEPGLDDKDLKYKFEVLDKFGVGTDLPTVNMYTYEGLLKRIKRNEGRLR